jgi:starch-binding outer membrane protein, SusD/RagB family
MTAIKLNLKGRLMPNTMRRGAVWSLLAAAALTACTQDLNITNPNAPSSDTFWHSQADAIAGINATYSGLLQRGTYGRWLGFAYDIRSDEGMSTSGWTELKQWNGFIQGDYNFEPPREIWWHHYWTIFHANEVIANVPNIEMDAVLRDRIVGEAKFIRALLYFNLVNLYGNVPLVLTPPQPTDRPPNATPAEVYAQIETDLQDAQAVLPASYPASDVGRATKGAALAMLGKAQLQQRKWATAAATLATVIAMPQYDLMPNYADNFTDKFENNVESVFEVQFGDESQLSNGVNGQNYAKMIGACQGAAGVQPSYCDGQPTRWFFNQFFPDTTNRLVYDPRLDATLFWNKPGGEDVYGTPFTARYGLTSNALWFKKWGEYYVIEDQNWDNPINYRVIRFADVLLMEAEALNESGQTAAAYPLVQRVRTRAGAGTVPAGMDQAAMRDYILHERLVELGLEQTRWLDLQRHDMLNASLATHDPEFAAFPARAVLLPIPQNEIDLNPNIKQNPGW